MNIVGRPILFWLIDHLTLSPDDTVWIGLPKEVLPPPPSFSSIHSRV